jgi:hypothetical protein
MKKTRARTTRPYPEFPFTVTNDDDYQICNIIHGLNYVRYLETELPGVRVVIDTISNKSARLILRYHTNNGMGTYINYLCDTYRIGINPSNPHSDGVLTGGGRKFAATFSEFVEKIRSQNIVIVDNDGNIVVEDDVPAVSE